MKLVINIPKAYYEYLKDTTEIVGCQRNAKVLTSVVLNAVAKGEPLKKDEINDVTPQQKTGRWLGSTIQGEIDGEAVKSFICSECYAISVFRMRGGIIVNGNLCPNCGAKMEDKV